MSARTPSGFQPLDSTGAAEGWLPFFCGGTDGCRWYRTEEFVCASARSVVRTLTAGWHSWLVFWF